MQHYRDAIRVCFATIAFSGLQGGAAIFEGIHTGSLALLGVGISLALDVGSSAVLVWRFRDETGAGTREVIAHRVARICLGAIGLGLMAGAIQRLATHSGPDVGALSLVTALTAVALLPLLARWKYAVAERVSSPALRTDAHITAVGAAMALVTAVGLAVTSWLGWWWADSAAAIVVALLAGRQLLPTRSTSH